MNSRTPFCLSFVRRFNTFNCTCVVFRNSHDILSNGCVISLVYHDIRWIWQAQRKFQRRLLMTWCSKLFLRAHLIHYYFCIANIQSLQRHCFFPLFCLIFLLKLLMTWIWSTLPGLNLRVAKSIAFRNFNTFFLFFSKFFHSSPLFALFYQYTTNITRIYSRYEANVSFLCKLHITELTSSFS